MVVADCSQSYFQKPIDCLATIYSPRKFIPVADGGFIKTEYLLESNEADEAESLNRFQYLVNRVIGEPELSRDLYLQAENSLKNISQRAMSNFSRRIIETTNLDYIRRKRRHNFKLYSALNKFNKIKFRLDDQVPLCYPLMLKNGSNMREKLLENRILTPKYWPNIIPSNEFEAALLNEVIHLPIDHRQDRESINRVIDVVMDCI